MNLYTKNRKKHIKEQCWTHARDEDKMGARTKSKQHGLTHKEPNKHNIQSQSQNARYKNYQNEYLDRICRICYQGKETQGYVLQHCTKRLNTKHSTGIQTQMKAAGTIQVTVDVRYQNRQVKNTLSLNKQPNGNYPQLPIQKIPCASPKWHPCDLRM